MSDELVDHGEELVSSATGRPLTKRGEATRRRLLEAAELVFAEQGLGSARGPRQQSGLLDRPEVAVGGGRGGFNHAAGSGVNCRDSSILRESPQLR